MGESLFDGNKLNDLSRGVSFHSKEDDSASLKFMKKNSITNDFQFKRPTTRNSFRGLFSKENRMAEETLRKKSTITPSTMNMEEFNFDIQFSTKKRPPQKNDFLREPVITDFTVALDYDPESPTEDVSTPKNHGHLRGRQRLTARGETQADRERRHDEQQDGC